MSGFEIVAKDVRASRALLLPGPLPPLSHLGATLFGYASHAALRYAHYQLGEPAPESSPTRFIALRPYLDGLALRQALENENGSAEVFGALLDPGGSAEAPLTQKMRGAIWFHRKRLGLTTSRLGSPTRNDRNDRKATPRARLSSWVPKLGDAFLGEIITVLERRQARAQGLTIRSVQSREAARFLDGSGADLSALGLPDPLVSSWLESRPQAPIPEPATELGHPAGGLRGSFREQWRRVLDQLRPLFLEIAERAVDRGYLSSAEEVFFLPFDLIEDLEPETKPEWLEPAIASNRAEWQEIGNRHAPADVLGNVETMPRLDIPPELTPLAPLL